MKHIQRWAPLALLLSAPASPADLDRTDFAYGIALETDGLAAVYHAPVPLVVYQNSARTDLGDIRVFNGRGEAVPYSLRRAPGEAEARAAAIPLPMFPLRGASVEPSDALKLRLTTAGASVEIDRPAAQGAPGTVTGYLIDARAMPGQISALNLAWDPGSADFSSRARIEASDDLSRWRRVADGPVVDLHYAGQQFLRQRVELPLVTAKFMRLSWAERALPVEITGVTGEPAPARTEVTRTTRSAPAVAVAGRPGEYLVDLDAHVPLDRVNLELPDVNTLATADFDARDDGVADWHAIAHATLYRLRTSDGSELTNPPVPIGVSAARHWRIRVARDGGGLGRGGPVFVGGWLPDDLVFVARGTGPFELVYGSGTAKSSAVPVEALLPRVPTAAADTAPMPIREARAGAPVTVGGPARLKPEVKKPNWRVFTLWAILVLGVGSLGWMAWRLLRQLPRNP